MLSLTQFAAIARQYGVDFEVQFAAGSSRIWVGGTLEEWRDAPFVCAVRVAGGRWINRDHGISMRLESLT